MILNYLDKVYVGLQIKHCLVLSCLVYDSLLLESRAQPVVKHIILISA